jgi:hypothetical protein
MFFNAIRRNDLQNKCQDWSLGSSLAPFDFLQEPREIIEICPRSDEIIFILTVLYCLTHGCFLPKFILADIERYKMLFAYWFVKGNLPL